MCVSMSVCYLCVVVCACDFVCVVCVMGARKGGGGGGGRWIRTTPPSLQVILSQIAYFT